MNYCSSDSPERKKFIKCSAFILHVFLTTIAEVLFLWIAQSETIMITSLLEVVNSILYGQQEIPLQIYLKTSFEIVVIVMLKNCEQQKLDKMLCFC